MTSLRVVAGLPFLELASSMSGKVKLSEARCCLGIAGLMRGPVLVPQAGLAGAAAAGADGASDGNARCDSVSTCAGVDALARGLTGESFRLGNGSGAPSSSCLFYVIKVF
jgi:hypothetical protein